MRSKNKHIRFLAYLMIGAFFASHNVLAEENVPIPPKRPKTMKVSPAFLEQLRQQGHEVSKVYQSVDTTKTDQAENVPEPEVTQALASPPPKMDAPEILNDVNPAGFNPPESDIQINVGLLDERSGATLMDITKDDVVNILEDKLPGIIGNVPVPQRKPRKFADASQHAEVTQNDSSPLQGENDVSTLVSFALKPEQIHLNADLENFLRDHAIRLFHNDPFLKMTIHSYATAIDNSEYSDVRLSLARALEVRSFLINHGINPSRLKLSPMGEEDKNNSSDRIDLVFVESH